METKLERLVDTTAANALHPVACDLVADGEFRIQRLADPILMLAQWEAAADVWQGGKALH